ncbi:MAG: DUF87 domain-containing protein, partial [Actinomycetia bacterium]|nr:DUF87 domain-containing protein [Actinomycetes bacterium]
MTFYLGAPTDASGKRVDNQTTTFDPSDLTTHGVIVGMTGSGKTGLGVIYLEEALRANIPTIIIDPKGDMTNLLLTFPNLAPADFRPWIDEGAAAKAGRTPDEEAAATADLWRSGLESWDISGEDITTLRSSVDMTIYTPGSESGVPLNVIGRMQPPELAWDANAETIRDEIQGIVSGLLSLIDVDADPIASREHILLSNLIENTWRNGNATDLPTLINQIATPPIRKLGVFDVDTFFPEKDRMAFAMRLNGLLASPSFASWMTGADLDIEKLLWSNGKPQASIIYLAHLSDTERQFIVTIILSRVITWMRSQPGSSDLRALIYMDEVFGFVPPTAEPPAKRPILTILKQARAFGVGMLLSTQNPVDLDYKAMSNAGTWCIGRLQTERDKARIIEALTTATGEVDIADLDATISNLSKRVFLLHSTKRSAPTVFTTRWAMSYLRGPMTREEIARITQRRPSEPTTTPVTTPPSPPDQDDATQDAPAVADGIDVATLHPAAPWASTVGYTENGATYRAALAVTVSTRYDETRLGIDHTETWEAILSPLTDPPDAGDLIEVDHDPRDFMSLQTDGSFTEPDAPISQKRYFDNVTRMIIRDLDARKTITVYRNQPLKLTSRPGESLTDFETRCVTAATDRADADIAKLTQRYTKRIRTARRDYEDAVRTADSAAQAIDDLQGEAAVGMVFDLLSGRRPRASSSKRRSAETRLARAEDKIEDKRARFEDLNDELASEVTA